MFHLIEHEAGHAFHAFESAELPFHLQEAPVEFMETFLSNYPSGNWIVRERARLVKAIDLAHLALR